jgi:hypothetical protein
MTAKFSPGHVLMTAAVAAKIEGYRPFADWIATMMQRHIRGDWGDIDPADARLNDQALVTPDGGFHSVYRHVEHGTIWIITDQGRAVTTVLFPDDY